MEKPIFLRLSLAYEKAALALNELSKVMQWISDREEYLNPN